MNPLFWETNEPDYINEEGIKWWIDNSTMQIAKLSKKYMIYVVQNKDYITRCVVDNQKGAIIYENQSLEALGCFCDILKFTESNEII